MNKLNKYHTLIIAVAVGVGLLLGQISVIKSFSEYLIVPFLMVMLFGLFLNIPFTNLLSSFSNLKFISANLIINFLWTPICAYLLGLLLLQEHLSLWIGFVMLMVTPCTDWYLIFTGNSQRKYFLVNSCIAGKSNFTINSSSGLSVPVFREIRLR